ncbi:MAG TPA: FAD-dependent oxidoreductase [Nitrolancea sp.]|nr:FAD-dependent oxidoreductase [Nitrolancea sp.]
MTKRRFVIVGAGLAGHSAAIALRQNGFDGDIILIGDEPARPYERPPLSKQFLQGVRSADELYFHTLEQYAELGIELKLGRRAVALDTARQQLTLDDSEQIGYDKLLLATGASPIRLRQPGFDLPGVHYLRTLADAAELGEQLRTGDRRVVVIGAGFIGSEVAASARMLGNMVYLVDLLPLPMVNALGETLGELFANVHRRHGVDLHMLSRVEELRGDGHVEAAVLADGEPIDCDLVIVGVGVRPDVELARNAGIEIENGIVVNELSETSAPNVYAAGDVAHWWHPGHGRRFRVEHYDNAGEHGAAAARSMLGAGEPYIPLPYFWSDQYDINLQYVGYPEAWDELVLRGDLDACEVTAFYLCGGQVCAAATVNRPRELRSARRICEARAVIEPATLADLDTDLRALSRLIARP